MHFSAMGRTLRQALCLVHMAIGALLAIALFATEANATIHLCRSMDCARGSGGGPGSQTVLFFSTASFTFDDGTTVFAQGPDFATRDGSIAGFFYSQDGLGVSDPRSESTWCTGIYACDPFSVDAKETNIIIRPNLDGLITFGVSTDVSEVIGYRADINRELKMLGLLSYADKVDYLDLSEGSLGGFECTGPVNEASDGFTPPFYCASDQYRFIVGGSYFALDGVAFIPEPSAVLLLLGALLAMIYAFKLRQNAMTDGPSN